MIEIAQLSKSFGAVKALDAVNLDIPDSKIFGFIGADGAGKTTLFRIITSLMLPDTGYVKVNGFDSVNDYKKIRMFIGYMAGRFSLYPDLTVEENISFYATIFGTSLEQNYKVIQSVYSQIEPFKKRPAGKLSGGMKQKLALSCALIHNPEILVLDEPTTGVDAVSRKEFWELLHELKKKGMTIIVSTPYMDEAGQCDEIAFIHKGKILANDAPSNISQHFARFVLAVSAPNPYGLLNHLRSFDHAGAYLFGQSIHFPPPNSFHPKHYQLF
ncbi:MAG: ABC transporter ATP-binding protein [Bacteroidales bacterium]|nr:ABC transporter ATP-binding protein [Bacteroidales bacterium]